MAPTHSVLMPLKSTREFPPDRWVNALVRSRLRACHLFIGVDYDDRLWAESHRALAEAALERANMQFTVVCRGQEPRHTERVTLHAAVMRDGPYSFAMLAPGLARFDQRFDPRAAKNSEAPRAAR